ncbi:phytoene/squalene synthase family protein [Aquibaculum arenosum]|uniref:Phytoene/squalene synthase family protein n=1 Tax=Aquibaculum arenosum TaxID=3032591 RepID=A0ABT5YPG6_9PROT|nr:phytoene/squalene synthase family protein [Fodinicurvata sp. CAU 1616]MDF2096723.1 phytoene/squalene synthase family protein [Fodinicurvata sp. CAU 1616]
MSAKHRPGRSGSEGERLPAAALELRHHDHDRYLLSLFAAPGLRDQLQGLFAFNHEIAKTSEVVSEAIIGQIRLQWWRESVEGLFEGTPREHYVIQVLHPAAQQGRLNRARLERLIDAREADLSGEAPADLTAFERYAEATGADLLRAALELMGLPADSHEALHRAARHIGIAYSSVGLLRAVPFHAAQKRIHLPEDHLAVAGVNRQDLFELRPQEALSGVAMRLAQRAEEHLSEAAKLVPDARMAKPVLLHGSLARLYLKRLAAADYNPFDPRAGLAPPSRMPRLAWLSWRGRW